MRYTVKMITTTSFNVVDKANNHTSGLTLSRREAVRLAAILNCLERK